MAITGELEGGDPFETRTISGIRHSFTTELEAAVSRGAAYLTSVQRADGSWEGVTDLGPTGAAMYWIVERKFGDLPEADYENGSSYLLSQQLDDGSFLPFPGARRGTAGATALCWAALQACGLRREHPALARARAFVDAEGGLDAVTALLKARGDVTPLFLLNAGVVDGSFLPPIPPELALTPFDRLVDRRIHAGNVMVTLVLCAMVAAYARPVPSGLVARAARKAEFFRIQRYLSDWQNESGDWNGQANHTYLMLLGLAATGVDRSDPRITRGLGWIRARRRHAARGVTVNSMTTDVWSTALATLALHAAGEPYDGPTLGAARRYLLGAQNQRPMALVNQRKPGAVRTGGWSFQRGNELMPDTDDTGLVLAALGRSSGSRTTRDVFLATENAMRWLRDMQSPDGGFSAYVWNLTPKRPGPMFLADIPLAVDDPGKLLSFLLDPPAEFSDPPSEGVTGRVLWGLGACGVKRDDPVVCRAIAFLRAQQCGNGGWWGRWMTCYLAETATTLLGLSAVGEDLESNYVQNALRFLRASQNPDGGFGETYEAYRDPSQAGRGPSTPPVTAFVLSALLATSPEVDPAVERAAAYLLSTQEPSGTWSNGDWLHTMIPPDSFYTFDLPAQTMPVFALGQLFTRLRGGR